MEVENQKLIKFKRIYITFAITSLIVFYVVFFTFRGAALDNILIMASFSLAWFGASIFLFTKGYITKTKMNYIWGLVALLGGIFFLSQIWEVA